MKTLTTISVIYLLFLSLLISFSTEFKKKKTKPLTPGCFVKVEGIEGEFKYLKKNIVRNLRTGRCISVKYEQIKLS